MHMKTGEMAGEIWQALSSKGPLTLSTLMNETEEDYTVLLMGLGWLLREDKIKVEKKGKAWSISLK
ncbi:MAG: hypothetical protein AMJ46_14460 [Latescibacteria bacterium DG_63]|nr:MAG: hypothetical protein AMJ46_14460 [Latescibacteria bacterium DG_63]